MNIAVICGGISTERNVSLVGGKAVYNALQNKGYNVTLIDPILGADADNKGSIFYKELLESDAITQKVSSFVDVDELSSMSPRSYIDCVNSTLFDNIDCAFLVLHGKYGEDGRMQSLLELRGIPYTGSGARASAIAMDKLTSKVIFSSYGIVTPPWEIVRPSDADNEEFLNNLRKHLSKQIVIKPANQGSTVGLTIIENGDVDQIADGIRQGAKFSSNLMAEKYIKGRELTVAILEQTPLPVLEIVPEDGFYDYQHKYTKGKTNYVCPANLPEDIFEFTQNMALSAYNAIGCKGFGRVDFILSDEGQPFCLEVNTIPGFSASSLVPMAAKANGIEFEELCERLIKLATNK